MCLALEETKKDAAENERIESIKSIMETLKLSAKEAMDA